MKIRIIDYGVGNLHSALKAFKLYCDDCEMTEDKCEILEADGIVLPGVGSFVAGMRGIAERGLADTIKEVHAQDTPIIGICLGAQLLLSKSEEFGTHEGLNLIPGTVEHFPEIGQRIPHIGWNEIVEDRPWKETILDGVGSAPEMYFVHSFYMKPPSKDHSLASTQYGDFKFTSAVQNGSTYGCQFHPEKSGETGLKIVENFMRLCG